MPQNALIVRVMLHNGLRIGDAVALRVDQIRPQAWITEQKTGKRRRCGFPAALRAAILAQTVPGNPWAFPGRKPGTHKTRQAVWNDLKRAAWALRVPANVGTHSARKVFAVELYEKTGDLAAVQRNLDHEYVSTTLIYALADELRRRNKTHHSQYKRRRSGGL